MFQNVPDRAMVTFKVLLIGQVIYKAEFPLETLRFSFLNDQNKMVVFFSLLPPISKNKSRLFDNSSADV